MTQEEKQLLVKALCGYLPYGVKVQYNNEIYDIDYISAQYEEVKLVFADNYTVGISEIKPYLRPMSSMTEEEKKEWVRLRVGVDKYIVGYEVVVDFYNRNHFDYRGLIMDGLAIEAPEGMYSI